MFRCGILSSACHVALDVADAEQFLVRAHRAAVQVLAAVVVEDGPPRNAEWPGQVGVERRRHGEEAAGALGVHVVGIDHRARDAVDLALVHREDQRVGRPVDGVDVPVRGVGPSR